MSGETIPGKARVASVALAGVVAASGACTAAPAARSEVHVPRPAPVAPPPPAPAFQATRVASACGGADDGSYTLLDRGRMVLEQCSSDCRALIPVGADGTLGAPLPCHLGNPALDEARRRVVRLADVHGRWPERLAVAAHVSVLPEVMPDLTVAPIPFEEPGVGALFAFSGGRWEARGKTQIDLNGVSFVGFGSWTTSRVIAPRVADGAVSWSVVHGDPSAAGLPGIAPVPAARDPRRFTSTPSGDALLLWEHDGPRPEAVVWRWRAGDPRPIVETLDDLVGVDVGVRSDGDAWMSGIAEGGPRVLHHVAGSWKVAHIWRETHPTARCTPATLTFAVDGAVWVNLVCGGSPLAGLWRRRPGHREVWDHATPPRVLDDGVQLASGGMAVGASDLLVVAHGATGGASLVRIHVEHPGGPRASDEGTSAP